MILRYLLIESLEVFVNYRLLSKYDSELKLTSDFLYYLLTTIRGKQTLGEEYCSIIPTKATRFPSVRRRIALCILNVVGPYLVNKVLRRFEQPFTNFLRQQESKLNESLQNNESVRFRDILKVHFLNLLPEVLFSNSVKNFGQVHLAMFFIWGRYYDVAKRLMGIVYKYESGLEGQHAISYLRPGRVIMFVVLI